MGDGASKGYREDFDNRYGDTPGLAGNPNAPTRQRQAELSYLQNKCVPGPLKRGYEMYEPIGPSSTAPVGTLVNAGIAECQQHPRGPGGAAAVPAPAPAPAPASMMPALSVPSMPFGPPAQPSPTLEACRAQSPVRAQTQGPLPAAPQASLTGPAGAFQFPFSGAPQGVPQKTLPVPPQGAPQGIPQPPLSGAPQGVPRVDSFSRFAIGSSPAPQGESFGQRGQSATRLDSMSFASKRRQAMNAAAGSPSGSLHLSRQQNATAPTAGSPAGSLHLSRQRDVPSRSPPPGSINVAGSPAGGAQMSRRRDTSPVRSQHSQVFQSPIKQVSHHQTAPLAAPSPSAVSTSAPMPQMPQTVSTTAPVATTASVNFPASNSMSQLSNSKSQLLSRTRAGTRSVENFDTTAMMAGGSMNVGVGGSMNLARMPSLSHTRLPGQAPSNSFSGPRNFASPRQAVTARSDAWKNLSRTAPYESLSDIPPPLTVPSSADAMAPQGHSVGQFTVVPILTALPTSAAEDIGFGTGSASPIVPIGISNANFPIGASPVADGSHMTPRNSLDQRGGFAGQRRLPSRIVSSQEGSLKVPLSRAASMHGTANSLQAPVNGSTGTTLRQNSFTPMPNGSPGLVQLPRGRATSPLRPVMRQESPLRSSIARDLSEGVEWSIPGGTQQPFAQQQSARLRSQSPTRLVSLSASLSESLELRASRENRISESQAVSSLRVTDNMISDRVNLIDQHRAGGAGGGSVLRERSAPRQRPDASPLTRSKDVYERLQESQKQLLKLRDAQKQALARCAAQCTSLMMAAETAATSTSPQASGTLTPSQLYQ